MLKLWNENKDDIILIMLNHEGDDESFSKTSAFCEKADCQPIEHPNYIHGAFVDAKPPGFAQFKMEYIPHSTLLDKNGLFLGNKVRMDQSVIDTALKSI